MKLKNKIAIVTGGSSGIGEASAKLFAKEGAYVFILDINKEKGSALAKEINGKFFEFDVSCEKSWKEVESFFKANKLSLDVLFNNAGITGLSGASSLQDCENCTLEDWNYIHSVNLNSIFLGCKYGIALMKQSGGVIVNMSSRSGVVGIPHACAYASSKAAIRNHTKSVALYCAEKKYNIRCNSLHPGAILTPMWQDMIGDNKEALDFIESGIPLGKMGTPQDVANAALFLACDDSKYMIGTELNIDGGILAGSASSPKNS